MSVRVLVVTHLSQRGYPLGTGQYCPTCATRITAQSRREYGAPSVYGEVHYYHLPDGTSERHRWENYLAAMCAGCSLGAA